MRIDMNMKYKVDITTDKMLTKLHRALYLSAVKFKEIAIRHAPDDTSLLRKRIKLYPNSKTANRYWVTSEAEYSRAVEYGTRPHWVPIKPLIEWARRHKGDEGDAYAVRWKIHEEGTHEHPFFRPAIRETRAKWIPFYYKHIFGG